MMIQPPKDGSAALAAEERRRVAREHLRDHLDVMAASIRPDTTSEEMDAAFDAALAAVRPRRLFGDL